MALELMNPESDDIRTAILESIGLPPFVKGIELVSEVIRIVASLRCPATSIAIRTATRQALGGLPEADDEMIELTIENLINIGDLVEVQEQQNLINRRIIYLGPLRYARRRGGGVLLFGIRSDRQALLPASIMLRVENRGYLRSISDADESDVERIKGSGLVEMDLATWLDPPSEISAADLVSLYERRISREQAIPDGAEGIEVIDPNSSSSYYRGRWSTLSPEISGRFVGRRPQRFGAPQWCYVEVINGGVRRLLDLPIELSNRGCDEAWRLQAAIDAERNSPQVLHVFGLSNGECELGITSPPPRWLQRRWDFLGSPIDRHDGMLFVWRFPTAEVREELQFAGSMLWLERLLNKGGM